MLAQTNSSQYNMICITLFKDVHKDYFYKLNSHITPSFLVSPDERTSFRQKNFNYSEY